MAKQDRRRQIMQAAEKLFTSRRFHEITTDDVAREAGVGKGTMYRYFADKEDLFFETAIAGFDELCDLMRQRVVAAGPCRDQLLSACVEISGFFDRRRQLFRMMLTEDMRISVSRGSLFDRWVEHRKKLVSAVAEIIRRGVEEGAIRDDVPADILADFLLGMLRTRARDLENAPASVRRLELLLDVFTDGAGGGQAKPGGRGSARRPAMAAARRAVGRKPA